ncbi:MAG: WecB/TagA/CpsF family glycosyltransferase [Terracidiphilus sp.]|jgi:N-acetylglucosaminyldiphosphoundecaprenol N-acetyl-beta-D-mannosaminyltransferase
MMRKIKHPIAVLGLPLDSLTAGEAVDAIEGLILSGGTHQVATANLDFWLNSLADQHLHRIIAGCSLVLPDGMPLVWASGLLGCPLAERVTGVDLVPRLADLSARKGYGIFLLGGKGNVAERAAKLLERNYPGVRIVGTYSPTEEHIARLDHSDILHRIHAAKPEILLVALGNPKQEKWIWIHRKRLGVPVAMGVGGSFEILVGDVRRAPKWIQHCGLEWLMRLVQEPSRLGPRYVRDFMGLGRRLPMTLLSAWLQRPYLGQTRVTTASTPQVMHVYVHGKLCAGIGSELQAATNASIANGLVMVAHLQTTRQVTAAGLGILMDVRRQLLESGLSLSLAGLNFKLRLLLHAWCAQPLFDEWEPAIEHGRSLAPETENGTAARIDLSGERDALAAQTRVRG